MSEFLTIPRAKCLIVYKEVLSHAQSKFASADHLAGVGDFGSAMSLHIIGLEELIKAFFLFLDGKGFAFRNVKGMKGVFENHGLRYLFSFFLFAFSVIGESFGIGIDHIRNINNEGDYKKIRAIKSNPQKLLREKILPYFLDKFRFIIEELKWFKDFDRLRQNGFYSGYDESLMSPNSVDEAFYREFTVRADRVTKTVLSIIDEFNSGHPFVEKHLPSMVKRAREKGFYNILERFIEYVREEERQSKNKKSALEVVSSNLTGFLFSLEADPPTFEDDALLPIHSQ